MSRLTPLQGKRVVVLPDLCVDTTVTLPRPEQAIKLLSEVAHRGGGNLHTGPITTRLGGNAGNMGSALAALGGQVSLIAEADAVGQVIAYEAAARTGLDVSLVRSGRCAYTIALECDGTNIMFNDPGPLTDISPDWLGPEEHEVIGRADAVAVLNWSQIPNGTALLQDIIARKDPDAILYLDTGDPSARMHDVAGLLRVVAAGGVDVWSMNENEARLFSGHSDALHGAGVMARSLHTRIDLHTRHLAASFGDRCILVPSEPQPGRRVTGAGDHWNAGNLAGYLLGFGGAERLQMAHRVATRFVTSVDGSPPVPTDIEPYLAAPA